MKFPVPMESWLYGNPEQIGDGVIARSERREKAEARKAEKPARVRKDRYYSQSRSIHIKEQVEKAKRGGLHHVSKRA